MSEIFHIPSHLVVECVTAHRKPPDVRVWRLSRQSRVGTLLSLEGHYLYALSGHTGSLDAFEVQRDGALTPLPGVSDLPIDSNGLAAR